MNQIYSKRYLTIIFDELIAINLIIKKKKKIRVSISSERRNKTSIILR